MSHSPILIAHRGASGYVPEHTQEAKVMAHAMGADFLEQDLVLTKDGVPIVLHDIHLETVTDVADRFPGRCRADGRFYAIDFTLAEIRELSVSERFDPQTKKAVFPARFPAHQGRFRISTFEEELLLIQGMNRSTGRQAGIYPEIKQPEFHHHEGQDLSRVTLSILTQHHYLRPEDAVYVQCFDPVELKRIRHELKSPLKLIQLLEDMPWFRSGTPDDVVREHLEEIATYADGIGPNVMNMFVRNSGGQNSEFQNSGEGKAQAADWGPANRMIELAHELGLVVHPWTYRADAMPAGYCSFEEMHQVSVRFGVDGFFSDFPDLSRKFLDAVRESA